MKAPEEDCVQHGTPVWQLRENVEMIGDSKTSNACSSFKRFEGLLEGWIADHWRRKSDTSDGAEHLG
jgi:hypothetical protein